MRRVLEAELNLIGVWQSYDLDFPGDAFRLGLSLLAKGKIDVNSMIYKTVGTKELDGVLREWREPGRVSGKIMVDFSDL